MLCLQQGVEMLSRQIRVTRLLLKKTQAMSHLNQNHQSLLQDPPVEEPKTRKYSQDKLRTFHVKKITKVCFEFYAYVWEDWIQIIPIQMKKLECFGNHKADFFEEYHRVTIGDYVIGTDLMRGTFVEPYVDEGTDEGTRNRSRYTDKSMSFSVELPAPTRFELTSISGDEGGSSVKFFLSGHFRSGKCEL